MRVRALLFLLLAPLLAAAQNPELVRKVTGVRGFAALWDFAKRTQDGRFAAHTPRREKADLSLEPLNYVHEYWHEGRPAAMEDFPVLREGPFGHAVSFRAETDPDFRPLLQVPRRRLHGSGIDVKAGGSP